MKSIYLVIAMLFVTSVSEAADSLKPLTQDQATVSKMELALLKRSILLLGTNHKPDNPKFNMMVYDEAGDKIIEYYTVEASEIDRVLAGDKRARETYRYRFKLEYEVMRNYLNIFGKDYGFEMSFATVGGDKAVIVDGVSIRRRGAAQADAAP